MNTEAPGPTASTGNRFLIPSDLGEWAVKPVLLQWIVEEIDTLDWSNPELGQFLRSNPGFQPRFLLVLMIYAYATARHDSEEVVETYYAEPTLKNLFPGRNPTAAGIRRFRREHRGLIRWGLAQLLKRALRHHFDMEDTASIPAGLNRLMVKAATTRLDTARHFDLAIQGE